jgi:hypothetical protein
VSDAEYDRWYAIHNREVLALPGFVAMERSILTFLRSSSGEAPPWRWLVRYEIEGELADAMAALRAAVGSGAMTFFDWYPGVVSAGFEAALAERLEKGAP